MKHKLLKKFTVFLLYRVLQAGKDKQSACKKIKICFFSFFYFLVGGNKSRNICCKFMGRIFIFTEDASIFGPKKDRFCRVNKVSFSESHRWHFKCFFRDRCDCKEGTERLYIRSIFPVLLTTD